MKMEFRQRINYYDNRFLMFILDKMAYEYELQGKDVIRMTLGKSELPVHPRIIGAMTDALEDFEKSAKVFPAGLPELKNELAAHYSSKYDVDIPADNFIISVGTSTIFRNLFHLLTNEKDEVLLPLPYYSLYNFCAQLTGASIKYYDIDLQTLRLNRESFKANYSDKTKIVVINTPGNPLGNILTEDELYFIDEVVNGRAIIINDEIYANMCFDDKGSSVMQLKNTKSTFITTDAFSKGYRMYSRRVGYCIVPDELVLPLTVIQHHTLLTADPVVQYGAIEALHHPDEIEILRTSYKHRRDYTEQILNTIDGIHVYHSKGSFYCTVDCANFMRTKGYQTSLALAEEIMKEKYVAVVPGSDFGLPYTIRLSFSSLAYEEGIDRLAEFFAAK